MVTQPEKVVENSNSKLLWDFMIFIDKSLPNNRPHITFVDRQQEHVYFIELSISEIPEFLKSLWRKLQSMLA